jgi:hypothetical protein
MMFFIALLVPIIATATRRAADSVNVFSHLKDAKIVPSYEEKHSNLRLEAAPKAGKTWQIVYDGRDSCDSSNAIEYIGSPTNRCFSVSGVRSAMIRCSKSKLLPSFLSFFLPLSSVF